MKALFIGLGSIGNRHSQNLKQLCREKNIDIEITALRSYRGSLNSIEFPQIDRMITKLDDVHYDLVFITNPTTLHADAFQLARPHGDYFFIEKPIFAETSQSPDDLGIKDINTYVAAPMRFCQTYIQLKKLLKNYEVFSSRIICSSFLPDWRPNQDYRQVYSAKKELGGGVTIDLIHEIDYMIDLFGLPERSFAFSGHYSNLEINSEDLYVSINQFPNLLCEVHLDYFGRTYRRTCECFCNSGTISADFGKGIISLPDDSVIHCEEDVNKRYLRELTAFLSFAIDGGENYNPPSLAYKTLKIAQGEY